MKYFSIMLLLLFIQTPLTYALTTPERSIIISVSTQTLHLMKDGVLEKSYPISTAKKGIGNISGSNKTPLGVHVIKEKVGKKVPIGGIIKKLVYTGKKAIIHTDAIYRETDLLTTRVLTLTGTEKGINKGGNVDSYSRGIMIHGTSEEGLIGTPVSHGCIRMRNKDIIELFDIVKTGTKVLIEK